MLPHFPLLALTFLHYPPSPHQGVQSSSLATCCELLISEPRLYTEADVVYDSYHQGQAINMSSSTARTAYGPPAKKVRIEEPRPDSKFKKDDIAVVRMANEDSSGGWHSAVIKVTTVDWDSEPGAWFYGGKVWGTEICLLAPESDVYKAVYAPGQQVKFEAAGREYCGTINFIFVGEDDDASEVSYEVSTQTWLSENNLKL